MGALGEAEQLADALDAQNGLREELRMEQEERLALEDELNAARASYDQLAQELDEIKHRNADLDIRENERNTVLEAKGQLGDDMAKLKAEYSEAERVRQKAEQDLT